MIYKGIKKISNTFTPATKQWSNGIAIKADTYKSCDNFCMYCFARALTAGMMARSGVKYDPLIARVMDIKEMAKRFDDANKTSKENELFLDWAIKTKRYIELGTMAEVFQKADQELRVTWNFMQLCRAYKMPLLINTKANLLVDDESYFRLVAEHPAPVILSLTLIGNDDKLMRKYEPRAPLGSERLKVAKRMVEAGVIVEFYLAPFMLGVSDQNLEECIHKMIETGASGLHLRNFYITGKLLKAGIWQNYIKQYENQFVSMGLGYKWSKEVMKEYYLKITEIAQKYRKDFDVVGIKTDWFDLNPYYGKANFDKFPKKFKEPLEDFTAIPIMRKIRENKDKPQLLLWNKIGYKEDKIDYPQNIEVGEGGACYLIVGECTTTQFFRNYRLNGFKWIRAGLWSGFDLGCPGGFLTTVNRIYPVKEGENWALASNDPLDFILAYIPPNLKNDYVTEGSVQLKSLEGALEPERDGGLEGKYL